MAKGYLGVNARHLSGKDVTLDFTEIFDICNKCVRMVLHVHA
jgi:hypothetical protein